MSNSDFSNFDPSFINEDIHSTDNQIFEKDNCNYIFNLDEFTLF